MKNTKCKNNSINPINKTNPKGRGFQNLEMDVASDFQIPAFLRKFLFSFNFQKIIKSFFLLVKLVKKQQVTLWTEHWSNEWGIHSWKF